MTKGTVKWFDAMKGYGFITDEDGKDYFFHHTNILMDGFRKLDADDLVEFEIESTEDGKEQAVKVTPIKTLKMIKEALKKENLFVQTFKPLGELKYLVVDENNFIQSNEDGLFFEELIKYAEGDKKERKNKTDKKVYAYLLYKYGTIEYCLLQQVTRYKQDGTPYIMYRTTGKKEYPEKRVRLTLTPKQRKNFAEQLRKEEMEEWEWIGFKDPAWTKEEIEERIENAKNRSDDVLIRNEINRIFEMGKDYIML